MKEINTEQLTDPNKLQRVVLPNLSPASVEDIKRFRHDTMDDYFKMDNNLPSSNEASAVKDR